MPIWFISTAAEYSSLLQLHTYKWEKMTHAVGCETSYKITGIHRGSTVAQELHAGGAARHDWGAMEKKRQKRQTAGELTVFTTTTHENNLR